MLVYTFGFNVVVVVVSVKLLNEWPLCLRCTWGPCACCLWQGLATRAACPARFDEEHCCLCEGQDWMVCLS